MQLSHSAAAITGHPTHWNAPTANAWSVSALAVAVLFFVALMDNDSPARPVVLAGRGGQSVVLLAVVASQI
jgi:hypothetical protein